MSAAREVLAGWHDALNLRDDAAIAAFVADQVQVVGRKGGLAVVSRASFIDRMIMSRVRLDPIAIHELHEFLLVVEERATWPELNDKVRTQGWVFHVDTEVYGVLRFPTLDIAFDYAEAHLALLEDP